MIWRVVAIGTLWMWGLHKNSTLNSKDSKKKKSEINDFTVYTTWGIWHSNNFEEGGPDDSTVDIYCHSQTGTTLPL